MGEKEDIQEDYFKLSYLNIITVIGVWEMYGCSKYIWTQYGSTRKNTSRVSTIILKPTPLNKYLQGVVVVIP